MSEPVDKLKKTPLYEVHRALGGKMVPFAGWEMPVQYTGLMEEHRRVRTACGIFDVSHMGEIEVRGPRALDAVQQLTTNDASRLIDGQVQYIRSALKRPVTTPDDSDLFHALAQATTRVEGTPA